MIGDVLAFGLGVLFSLAAVLVWAVIVLLIVLSECPPRGSDGDRRA